MATALQPKKQEETFDPAQTDSEKTGKGDASKAAPETEPDVEQVEQGVGALSLHHEIVHPLQNSWTWWYFKPDPSVKNWSENQRKVYTFSSVEGFWGTYHHLTPVSRINVGCDYSVFKEGIQPMWEDEANKNGGRWLLNFDKHMRAAKLDKVWLEALLCLVGEAFDEESDQVNGATCNVRQKTDKLAVWTARCNDKAAVQKIGRKLKDRLFVPPNSYIGYQSHGETMNRRGSQQKDLYRV